MLDLLLVATFVLRVGALIGALTLHLIYPSMREFPYAMNCLEQIASAWEQGKHVITQVVDPEFDVMQW